MTPNDSDLATRIHGLLPESESAAALPDPVEFDDPPVSRLIAKTGSEQLIREYFAADHSESALDEALERVAARDEVERVERGADTRYWIRV